MAAERGRFITLEGGEGAGKSTQIALLEGMLRAVGKTVLRTREPGGAPGVSRGSNMLRDILLMGEHQWTPKAEVLLHFAARAEHVEVNIRPAIENGSWVICDRYADSTMVYQGWGQGADTKMILELADMMELTPDLTIVLDVPVATTQARLASRGAVADRYERLGAAFFARIREGFLAVAGADPQRCRVVSAEKTQEEVAADIWDIVRTRFDL
jgi:dTMP kinase